MPHPPSNDFSNLTSAIFSVVLNTMLLCHVCLHRRMLAAIDTECRCLGVVYAAVPEGRVIYCECRRPPRGHVNCCLLAHSPQNSSPKGTGGTARSLLRCAITVLSTCLRARPELATRSSPQGSG